MVQHIISPNVSWKIENVSSYCKRKSPSFTFRNANWQLKFVYYKTPQEIEACEINLKCSGNESTCEDIIITSYCVFAGSQCFERTVEYNYSELKEMALFRESSDSFKGNETIGNDYTSICEFWEKSYFVCSINIKNWTPIPEGPQIKDPMDDPTDVLENSPCITRLCYDFEKLFDSHERSDITLISKDQNFDAHKNILSARSDEFAAMFRNDTKESEEKTVDMTDMDSAVLQQFLRYLYSGKAPELSLKNVYQLYAAAQKFNVEALKLKCITFMEESVETETTSEASEADDTSSDFKSKNDILSHFDNIKAVLSTKEWEKLVQTEPLFAYEAFAFMMRKPAF